MKPVSISPQQLSAAFKALSREIMREGFSKQSIIQESLMNSAAGKLFTNQLIALTAKELVEVTMTTPDANMQDENIQVVQGHISLEGYQQIVAMIASAIRLGMYLGQAEPVKDPSNRKLLPTKNSADNDRDFLKACGIRVFKPRKRKKAERK